MSRDGRYPWVTRKRNGGRLEINTFLDVSGWTKFSLLSL